MVRIMAVEVCGCQWRTRFPCLGNPGWGKPGSADGRSLRRDWRLGSPQGVGKWTVENTGGAAFGSRDRSRGHLHCSGKKHSSLSGTFVNQARASGDVVTGHLEDHPRFHCLPSSRRSSRYSTRFWSLTGGFRQTRRLPYAEDGLWPNSTSVHDILSDP